MCPINFYIRGEVKCGEGVLLTGFIFILFFLIQVKNIISNKSIACISWIKYSCFDEGGWVMIKERGKKDIEKKG